MAPWPDISAPNDGLTACFWESKFGINQEGKVGA